MFLKVYRTQKSCDFCRCHLNILLYFNRHQDPVLRKWNALIVEHTMKHGSVMGILMELQDSYARYLLADNYHNIILFFS